MQVGQPLKRAIAGDDPFVIACRQQCPVGDVAEQRTGLGGTRCWQQDQPRIDIPRQLLQRLGHLSRLEHVRFGGVGLLRRADAGCARRSRAGTPTHRHRSARCACPRGRHGRRIAARARAAAAPRCEASTACTGPIGGPDGCCSSLSPKTWANSSGERSTVRSVRCLGGVRIGRGEPPVCFSRRPLKKRWLISLRLRGGAGSAGRACRRICDFRFSICD